MSIAATVRGNLALQVLQGGGKGLSRVLQLDWRIMGHRELTIVVTPAWVMINEYLSGSVKR